MGKEKIEPVLIDGRKYLSVEDAATLSGKLPVTIYQNISRGNITHRLVLGRIAVPMDEVLERWVESGTMEVSE